MKKLINLVAALFLVTNVTVLFAKSVDGEETASMIASMLVSADRSTRVFNSGLPGWHHENAEFVLEYHSGAQILIVAEEMVLLKSAQDSAEVDFLHASGSVSLQKDGRLYEMDEVEMDIATGIIKGSGARLTVSGPDLSQLE